MAGLGCTTLWRNLIVLCTSALCLFETGCGTTQTAQGLERTTKGILRKVEPTGTLDEVERRGAMWEQIKLTVESIDTSRLNEAVESLYHLIEKIQSRIDAISPEAITQSESKILASLEAIQADVESAQLRRPARAVEQAADQIEHKVGQINVGSLNLLTRELTATLGDFRDSLDRITKNVDGVLSEMEMLVASVNDRVNAVSTEEFYKSAASLRESSTRLSVTAAELPRLTQQVTDTLSTVRLGVYIVLGVACVFGLIGMSLLLRVVRGGSDD